MDLFTFMHSVRLLRLVLALFPHCTAAAVLPPTSHYRAPHTFLPRTPYRGYAAVYLSRRPLSVLYASCPQRPACAHACRHNAYLFKRTGLRTYTSRTHVHAAVHAPPATPLRYTGHHFTSYTSWTFPRFSFLSMNTHCCTHRTPVRPCGHSTLHTARTGLGSPAFALVHTLSFAFTLGLPFSSHTYRAGFGSVNAPFCGRYCAAFASHIHNPCAY